MEEIPLWLRVICAPYIAVNNIARWISSRREADKQQEPKR